MTDVPITPDREQQRKDNEASRRQSGLDPARQEQRADEPREDREEPGGREDREDRED